VYLTYLDESGCDKKSPFVVVGALMVEDQMFFGLDTLVGVLAEKLLPEEIIALFEEFHACELAGGYGVFDGISQKARYDTIGTILACVRTFKCRFIYSAISKEALAKSAFGGANPVDVAFRMCLGAVVQCVEQNLNNRQHNLALMIMDDSKELKSLLKTSFRALRGTMRPPKFAGMLHIHDDMYFGDSRDSVGIQLADLCTYFTARQLSNTDPGFFRVFSDCAVCAKVEPEWSNMRGIFLCHEEAASMKTSTAP
jgi:hypothetical protein